MDVQLEIDRICSWIKNYVRESGKTNVVIGLSGGVDSAVCAALCAKALGRLNVFGVIMPCGGNIQDTDDAIKLAKLLNIPYEEVDLAKTHKVLEDEVLYSRNPETSEIIIMYNETATPLTRVLSKANMKSRLRMTTLYFISTINNSLVCGTTNKCEMFLGYFTKHGDGGVDFEPLANYLKSEVYEIAKYLSSVIPYNIITKDPSAGLWTGQTDEDEMGFTYAQLEDCIKGIESKDGYVPRVSGPVLLKIIDWNKSIQHKLHAPLCCPR